MKPVPTILLAVLWCALTFELSLANVVLGLVVGAVLSVLYRADPTDTPKQPWTTRALRVVRKTKPAAVLAVSFLWDLLTSSVRLGLHVLKPRHVWNMAIVPVAIEPRCDRELVVLSTLITLTPGTLTVDVTPDRKTLYVHVMAADDCNRVREALEQGVVQHVRRLFA